jgi:hypothetical protein
MPNAKSNRGRSTQAKAKQEKGLQDQPRALTSNLLEIPTHGHGHHRAGLQLELQKLGSEEAENQFHLFEMLDTDARLEGRQKPEMAGLDLTVQEDRAVTALQKLLHATDYQGQKPTDTRYSQEWKRPIRALSISFTWPEFYEAYGLKRLATGRYSGKEAADARDALISLERPFFITFKLRYWEGEGKNRRERTDRAETLRPLITITKGYKGLELTEDAALDALDGHEERTGRATHLLVEVSPLLSYGIEDFYILKPNRLHEEIKLALGSKRNVSPSVHLFISWILTKNTTLVKATKKTLAERLRLSSYIQHRKWKRLDEQLLECFHVAQELGFLEAWKEVAPTVMEFHLNAERCSRIRQRAEQAPALAT